MIYSLRDVTLRQLIAVVQDVVQYLIVILAVLNIRSIGYANISCKADVTFMDDKCKKRTESIWSKSVFPLL